MSPVSERVVDASPPEWEGRVVRSLTLEALALLQAGQSGASSRLDQCDAPSLAMSTRTAEERDSQSAQRDELAHSHTVPTRGGVLPPADDASSINLQCTEHAVPIAILRSMDNQNQCSSLGPRSLDTRQRHSDTDSPDTTIMFPPAARRLKFLPLAGRAQAVSCM